MTGRIRWRRGGKVIDAGDIKVIDAGDIFSQEHGSGLESVASMVGQDRSVSFRALRGFIGPAPRDEFIGAQAVGTRYTRT
jgi:hypothetical protein